MDHSDKLIEEIQSTEQRYSRDTVEYSLQSVRNSLPDRIVHVPYTGYLSDSSLLRQDLHDNVVDRKGGMMLSLYAPCGAGKTCFCLCEIPKMLPDMTTILAVPNTIQAEQNANSYEAVINGKKVPVIPVTGRAKNCLQLELGKIYSIVFDCAKTLRNMLDSTDPDDDRCRNIFFIIDEAHLLIDAETYRAPAVNAVREAAGLVLRHGGIVMIMTGTPDKLLGVHTNVEYQCFETRDGKEIPACNFRKMTLVRKDNKNANFQEFIDHELHDLLDAGEIPFARYNDKKVLEREALNLRREGYKVHVLSSAKKGYCLITDPETGETCRRYDDPCYGKLQEEATLPYADVYLTTSIVEVGTSVRYVEDVNGNKIQPDNLTPVMFCNSPEAFDLDAITQFDSRPRFPVGRAVVAMNMTPHRPKAPLPLKTKGECIVEAADADLKKIGADVDCFMTPGVGNDSREDRNLIYDRSGIVTGIDRTHLFASAEAAYSRQGYTNPEIALRLLQDAFPGIEITEETVTDIEKLKNGHPMPVSDNLAEAFRDAAEDPNFVKALTGRNGFDRKNDKVNQFASDPAGKNLMTAGRKFLSPGCYKTPDAIEIAISSVSKPGKPVTLSDGSMIPDPDLDIENHALLKIAGMKPWKQRKLAAYLISFVDPVPKEKQSEQDDINHLFTEEELNWTDIIIGSPNCDSIAKALLCFEEYYTNVKLSDFFRMLAKAAHESFPDWINRAMRIMKFNSILTGEGIPEGKRVSEYIKTVHYDRSKFDAEYHSFVRNEKSLPVMDSVPSGTDDRGDGSERGWFYPDRKYSRLPEEEQKQHSSLHYEDGFIGKSLTRYDFEQIAQLLPGKVKGLCHTRDRLYYSGEDVRKLFCTIFSTRTIENPSRRTDFRVQVVSLRKHVPKNWVWASVSEEEAVAAVEDIVLHESIPVPDPARGTRSVDRAEDAADDDVSIRQIEKILRQNTMLGSSAESEETLHNALGWLNRCRMSLPQDQQMYHYRKGQLAVLIDLERKRIAYNQQHRDHPDSDQVRIEDEMLAETLGGVTDWAVFVTERQTLQRGIDERKELRIEDKPQTLLTEQKLMNGNQTIQTEQKGMDGYQTMQAGQKGTDGVFEYHIPDYDTGEINVIRTDNPTLKLWFEGWDEIEKQSGKIT